MSGYRRITVSDAPATRLGKMRIAGEINDDVPVMPRELRILDEFVVSVVFAGDGLYRDATGRRDVIRARTVTIVPPGVPHWYGTRIGEKWTEWFAVVDGPLFHLLQQIGVLDVAGPAPLAPGATSTALAAILQYQPMSPSAAEHQLLSLSDWIMSACRPPEPDPRWSTAVERLTVDFSTPVDLQVLAADLGLSYAVFRRRFTAQFGQPPLAFRNARRLEAAATLFRLTSMTVREVADRLGYADEFHLSRRFARHFGLPPRDYRRAPAPLADPLA